MNIRVVDNFLSDEDSEFVLKYCYSSSYSYGETDEYIVGFEPTKCTGLVHNISYDDSENSRKIYTKFKDECKSQFSELDEMQIYRMSINCFAPSENPYFHTDGECGYTALYYPNIEWNLDDNGETQLYMDDILYGIPPLPNRMLLFPANIKHRATTFRDKHRFTVVVRYEPINNPSN
jgi:hypothetical protein